MSSNIFKCVVIVLLCGIFGNQLYSNYQPTLPVTEHAVPIPKKNEWVITSNPEITIYTKYDKILKIELDGSDGNLNGNSLQQVIDEIVEIEELKQHDRKNKNRNKQ